MANGINTVVFPVAGLGTRFMPATKVVPKEMLPVVDRPLLQYGVEEAIEAGINNFVFVVGAHNRDLIKAHFTANPELEKYLEASGKTEALDAVRAATLNDATVHFVEQDKPLGLGHAVWCARDVVGDGPFAVLLPDDMVLAKPGCLKQMVDAYAGTGNLVAVEDIPRTETYKYGILDVTEIEGSMVSARGLVEKPEPEAAPSTLSVIGRYILDGSVFAHLDGQRKGAGGEIQLTDAIAATIGEAPFRGLLFAGHRFDCGTQAGFVAANSAYLQA